jgi:DNA repair exonuclease SbcCD ATPase subunit
MQSPRTTAKTIRTIKEDLGMNKLEQVKGLLRAIKNIALQGIYAETYRGMEAQCVTTYRKCIATLKTVSGYEEVESLAPELADNAMMKEISFAVETALSLISQGEGPTMQFGPGRGFHMPHVQVRMRHGRQLRCGRGPGRRVRHSEHVEELEEEMQEKMEEEQERFEESIEKIEEEVEELQDKVEEIRDRLEERLEEIREKYEEKIEEIEEAQQEEEDEEEEDEDKDKEPKA